MSKSTDYFLNRLKENENNIFKAAVQTMGAKLNPNSDLYKSEQIIPQKSGVTQSFRGSTSDKISKDPSIADKSTKSPSVTVETVVPSIKDTDEASKSPESTTESTPEYQKYLDMQKQYIEEYLNRGEFDVNADALYKMYYDETLKQAEMARRHTTAQAAALTGGYGSSYANALGAAAANETMDVIPELYDAALARYNSEGEELLKRAQLAGEYGEALYLESPELLSQLQEDELFKIEQALRSNNVEVDFEQRFLSGDYDIKKWNDSGAKKYSWYDAAVDIYAKDTSKTDADIKKELMSWKTSDGTPITSAQVDALMNLINSERLTNYYSKMQDSSGKYLGAYLEELVEKGLDGETIYSLLEDWEDYHGIKLTENDIINLISSI